MAMQWPSVRSNRPVQSTQRIGDENVRRSETGIESKWLPHNMLECMNKDARERGARISYRAGGSPERRCVNVANET